MNQSLNWSYLQSFVAVANQRSLTGAATALGASQPTMGRHIAALEHDLGVQLFERTAAGLELTDTGTELLQHAEQMAQTANRFSLAAEGRSETIAGTIRITASEIMATYVLPKILTGLHQAEPEIEIELVASDKTENLLRRDADIAIRMYRPQQADIITRKVCELPLGAYAANSYIKQHGAPESLAELKNHKVVGYDRNELIIKGLDAFGLKVDRHFFPFRSDNQVVAWKMVVAGFGIGFNQLQIGDSEPQVSRIDLGGELPSIPVWLTAHSELKTSLRVRRVYDFLAAGLRG